MNVTDIATRLKQTGETVSGSSYRKSFPFCTAEALFLEDKFVSLKITEHFFDPEFKPRSRSDLHQGNLRTVYSTSGDELNEVEYEGVMPANGKFITSISLRRYKDGKGVWRLTFADAYRFENLVAYVGNQLNV